jgi:dolichyl-phosphate-mannose--protein O-mannosyl transferase
MAAVEERQAARAQLTRTALPPRAQAGDFTATRTRALRWLMPACAITATWLPWAVVGRFGMAYYLLPALPFTSVVVAHAVAQLRLRHAATIYAALVVPLFVIAYPVLAAVPIPRASFERHVPNRAPPVSSP